MAGSLRQRGNGSWQLVVYRGYDTKASKSTFSRGSFSRLCAREPIARSQGWSGSTPNHRASKYFSLPTSVPIARTL